MFLYLDYSGKGEVPTEPPCGRPEKKSRKSPHKNSQMYRRPRVLRGDFLEVSYFGGKTLKTKSFRRTTQI